MVNPPLVLKKRVNELWVDKISFRMRDALLRGATSFVNADPLRWNVATGMPAAKTRPKFRYPIVITVFNFIDRCHSDAAASLDCRQPTQILAVLPIFVSVKRPLLPVRLIAVHASSSAFEMCS
jgi:hypothetical protein